MPATVGARSQPKRVVDKEQFFTTDDLVLRCLQLVEDIYGKNHFRGYIEPSAGDGAFLRHLPEVRRIGLDIAPLAEGIERADFLSWSPPRLTAPVLTVGNPPFGARGGMAMRFLHQACGFSDVVAFILPRSFRRESFFERVDRRFHLVRQLDCDTFRRPDGSPVTVKAVFQVWERRDSLRAASTRPSTHPDFDLKHFHLSRTGPLELERARRTFDFALPQVGTTFPTRDLAAATAGSLFFVRARHESVRDVFDRLDFSFLDGLNTTFKSLSRRDVIEAYVAASGRPAIEES